jgi:hypothetical protein
MVARKLTKSSPETVGQVTGSIAHDLNNILGIIIGNLGLLQELCDDRPDIGEFARDAMTAALQGSSLTQRLFAFAQRQQLLDASPRTRPVIATAATPAPPARSTTTAPARSR